MTFPTLKLMKDFIKDALQPEDGGLKGLDCINYVRQGATVRQMVDVSKWFFESFHGSHANKKQKQWIETNILKSRARSHITKGFIYNQVGPFVM